MSPCSDIIVYYHGRATSNDAQVWVSMMVDTFHIPALEYMRVVAKKNAATPLQIIQNHVAPGTIIHSDHGSVPRPNGLDP